VGCAFPTRSARECQARAPPTHTIRGSRTAWPDTARERIKSEKKEKKQEVSI